MQRYGGTPDGSPKAMLRTWLAGQRREHLPARDREADAAAIASRAVTAVSEAGLGAGATAAAYESLRSEPPTQALVSALQAHGIRVLVPITQHDWTLDWADAADPDRTPLGQTAIGGAAVVFVPAQAVDRTGARLGRGRGCYDRALALAPGARRIAVVHPWELLEDGIPTDPHDLPMDAAITADESADFSSGRRAPG